MASAEAKQSRGSAADAYGRAAAHALRLDLGFVLVFLTLALGLMFAPVLTHAGWPNNHEGLSWKYRLLTYVAHFRRLDLLPVWSESAALGMGAPSPVLYHKLFYFVAAPLYLLSGSVKASVVVALGVFAALGSLGMRSLLCCLGVPARAALVAGSALLFCSYAYTNWLVRGAFAEFSAMFLLPWLFRWLAGVLQGEPPGSLLRLGIALFPALYLAHASLFFFAAVPVLSASAWRIITGADCRLFVRALLGVGAAFTLVALPISLCQLLVVQELSFAEGIAFYQPRDFYAPLARHLFDAQHVWGTSWEKVSVQLDLPLVAFALIGLAWAVWLGFRQRNARSPALPAYLACWAASAYYAFLLSPLSEPLYSHVPGFASLQFPWRLLSFTSLLSVALAAVPLLARLQLRQRDLRLPAAGLLLAVTYACSPWRHEIRYAWMPQREVEAPLPATARLVVGGFEYHPRVEGIAGTELIDYIDRLRPRSDALEWARPDYSVKRIDEAEFEKGERTYRVRSARPSSVVFPIAYSPFIRVESTQGRIQTYREPRDPRIHFQAPAGELDVVVRFPTLLSLCADVLRGTASRSPEP